MANTNLVGQVLLNQFRVDAFIASGGMSVVYKVWDLQRSVHLAMKVLNADLADDPGVFRRFQREANALMRLTHPNIVPFYGLYEAPVSSGRVSFLLEAFIGGPSLREVLGHRRNHCMPLIETLTCFKALCAALGYAHSQGVIHCDVKPANILVDPSGAVYLTDFGIARQLETSQTMTNTLGQIGTPAYMAPEQIRGDRLSPAVDIYALGVLLFEMLTGQRPFQGKETPDTSPVNAQSALPEPTSEQAGTISDRIRYAHLHYPPPDPRSVNPELSPALSEVILKALAKDPAERYVSAGALYQALLDASGYRPEAVPDRVAPPAQPDEGSVLFDVPRPPSRRSARFPFARSCLALAVLALLAVALVAGIGAIRMRGLTGLAIPATGGGGAVAAATAPAGVPGSAAQTPGAQAAVQPAAPQSGTGQNAPADPSATRASPGAVVPPTATASAAPTATPIPPTATAPTRAAAGQQAANNPTAGTAPPAYASSQQVSPKDGMTQIRVPAGPFIMGSDSSPWPFEAPQHTVTLDDFWIDKTEVTNAMFAKFVAATNYQTDAEKAGWAWVEGGAGNYKQVNGADWRQPLGPGSSIQGMDNYPVVQVSWNDAQAYAQWAGRRMPTEAEWEKAARGTDGRTYPWGSQIDCAHANYNPDSNGVSKGCVGGITPVDAYPDGASPYGVLDMTGNVWNWVSDWYQSDYYAHSPNTNPTGPAKGTTKVHKGGAWDNFNLQVQPSYRFGNNPAWSYNSLGFRCAMTP